MMNMAEEIVTRCALAVRGKLTINYQRERLEEQVRRPNKKEEAAISGMKGSEESEKIKDDTSYEVTLDEDFVKLWNMECLLQREWVWEWTGS